MGLDLNYLRTDHSLEQVELFWIFRRLRRSPSTFLSFRSGHIDVQTRLMLTCKKLYSLHSFLVALSSHFQSGIQESLTSDLPILQYLTTYTCRICLYKSSWQARPRHYWLAGQESVLFQQEICPWLIRVAQLQTTPLPSTNPPHIFKIFPLRWGLCSIQCCTAYLQAPILCPHSHMVDYNPCIIQMQNPLPARLLSFPSWTKSNFSPKEFSFLLTPTLQ